VTYNWGFMAFWACR